MCAADPGRDWRRGTTWVCGWSDFRRTFAGNLLDNGNDLVTVQKLMGHASPTTTANYDRRGEEVRRKASKTLHVPYQQRPGLGWKSSQLGKYSLVLTSCLFWGLLLLSDNVR